MKPKVSVRVITYNQENYIQHCIEGILMQKTNFPFEIIIGEDCSTDRTREIVLQYQSKYPDLIRVITSDVNIGAGANVKRVSDAALGEYHALCEGDDYWIDPLKLQKQYDFMQAHPEVSLSYHNALILSEESGQTRLFYKDEMPILANFEDACSLAVPTCSIMLCASTIQDLPEWRTEVWCSDLVMRLWCAHKGPLGCINEIMATYRVHPRGLTSGKQQNLEKYFKQEQFLFDQLNVDTGKVHQEILSKMKQQSRERYLRRKNPFFFYLTNPVQILLRLQQYWRGILRFRLLKDYGQPG